jgi:hypothetical protein
LAICTFLMNNLGSFADAKSFKLSPIGTCYLTWQVSILIFYGMF